MAVDFDSIQLGGQYDWPQLSATWGFESFHAIAIVHKPNSRCIKHLQPTKKRTKASEGKQERMWE